MNERTIRRFRTAYNYGPRRPGVTTPGGSKVQKHAKDECDINILMKRYEKTGALPEMIRTDGTYGDYSDAPSYQEALHIVQHAHEQFAALDAPMRNRFKNDPAGFLEWANDEGNLEEMATLGLLKPEAVERVQAARKRLQEERQAPPERSPKAKKPDNAEG